MYEPQLQKKTVAEILGEDLSEYLLPSIQRDFEWDEDDIKEMIESLLRGYPIGIITVFKTDIEFPSVPIVDPPNANQQAEKKSKQPKLYVLDGQQRLTSLMLIKHSWKITRNSEPIERKPIYLNPDVKSDDKKLRVKGKNPMGHDFSELIQMAIFKQPSKEYLRETLQELQQTFLNRPIAFHVVEVAGQGRSEDEIYEDMAEIFTRINRSGIRLGNLEMFLSFFAYASVAKEQIVALHKEVDAKYTMDLEPIIRFVFSNFSLSQNSITKTDSFKKAVNTLKTKYTSEQIKDVIERCKTSIETTMKLLHEELGLTNTKILPAETVLVPIFQYMFTRELTSVDDIDKSDKNLISKWLLLASFNGIYSSSTNSRLQKDLEIISGSQKPKAFPFRDLLESMKNHIKTTEITEKDFVNVDRNILRGNAGKRYLLLLYVLLFKNQATDWAGKPIYERKFSDLARHHIFPKDLLKKEIDDEVIINCIGNLTFIDSTQNSNLREREPEDYLNEFDSEILKRHFIPMDRELWKMDNFEKFVEQRTRLLWTGVQELLKSLEYTSEN